MPKISVIIPTYNRSDMLIKSINSVISQTYKDIELIIVDDGSTDNTAKIVKDFYEKDNRIIYVHTENSGGPAHPKNVGIKIARGEYIAFLDDDDEWMPKKLEKQIFIFEKTQKENLVIVSCDSVVVNVDGEVEFKPSKIINYGVKDLLIKNSIFTGTVLVKTSVIRSIDLFDEKLLFLEDWDMWIRLLADNKKIRFCPEILFKYNVGNISTTKNTNNFRKIEALEYVYKKNKKLYEEYNVAYKIAFRIAVKYYLEQKNTESRKYFRFSFLKNKFYLPAYIGYLISFFGNLGRYIFYFLIKVYRMTNGRQWGKKFN